MHVAKTKALIICAVTMLLTCTFVFFAYAKSRFPHDAAHLSSCCHLGFTKNRNMLFLRFLKVVPDYFLYWVM